MDKETANHYKAYLINLDKQRKQALESQDALSYYNLCNEYGCEPENSFLYEQGKAEFEFQQKKEQSLEAIVDTGAEAFLRKVGIMDLNNFQQNSDYKKKLLMSYFPGKFGRDGSQSLEAKAYTPMQIGYMFRNVVLSYKKKR